LPKPQIQTNTRKKDANKFEITLTANSYSKSVFLEVEGFRAFLVDNFFDLILNQRRTVTCKVEADFSLEKFYEALKVETNPKGKKNTKQKSKMN
jgi:hypothetical protein